MEGFSILMPLVILLGGVAVCLIGLLIYRSILEFHEEDQIFLDRAEAALEKQNAQMLGRILRLETVLKGLGTAFGGLLLIIVALWVYQGLYG